MKPTAPLLEVKGVTLQYKTPDHLVTATYRIDFEVFEAVDGLDALAALDRVRPDIIVLDLRMPHLDGMGFLRQMERRGSKVPVVVCSGAFTTDSPPSIAGVFPAQKSPDLRNVWSAIEAALPKPQVEVELAGKARRAVEATAVLAIEDFLPAVGQGIIAIESRIEDTTTRRLLAAINHADTASALAAERAFLAELDGSCRTPIAGHATLAGGRSPSTRFISRAPST